jgi:uncharacterized protein (TIGR00299 family) protein
MRLGYLDVSAGISGDMFVAALIDAGAPVELLHDTLRSLGLGATLDVYNVNRSGIESTKADIRVDGELAEVAHGHRHDHGHAHDDHHDHGNGHDHTHRHESPAAHEHHRSHSEIRSLIEAAALPTPVKDFALRAFRELAQAESKIHGIGIDEVHFHEVGAVDAIADIVLAAAAVHALGVDAWHASTVNVGSGSVQCAHGRFPVPAPATAELLRGLPTYADGPALELTTPTGAALLRTLGCAFGPQPAMLVEKIGYGAGGRNPAGFANVLRVSVGPPVAAEADPDLVTILETAVDDANPQVLAYVADKALELGAFDFLRTPVLMKKGRTGTLLTVLCAPEQVGVLQDLLLRETSTIGLRIRQERRLCLEREFVTVETAWGPVRIKVARCDGKEWNAMPEFEDCRELAERNGVPLKVVMAAAVRAHRPELA